MPYYNKALLTLLNTQPRPTCLDLATEKVLENGTEGIVRT